MSKKVTTEDFIKKVKSIYHEMGYDYFIYDKTIYRGYKQDVTITCPYHGDFTHKAGYITTGSHLTCRECSKKRLNERFSLNQEEFLKRMHKIYGDKYDFSEFKYVNNKTKSKVICKKHGAFYKDPYKLTYRRQACVKCSMEEKDSFGIKTIKTWLESNNIKYVSEYKIKDHPYLKNKPYDIFLPSYNVLIEYDGSQHFHKKFNMTDEDLRMRKEIDLNKTKLAKDLGYKLFRLNYKMKETEINSFLDNLNL